MEFPDFVNKTFENNLASGATSICENVINHSHPDKMFDLDINTYWETEIKEGNASCIIELPEEKAFNLVVMGENISYGQKVESFEIEVFRDDKWIALTKGTSIGYKRILKTELTHASKLKLIIKNAKDNPMISTFGLYLEAR